MASRTRSISPPSNATLFDGLSAHPWRVSAAWNTDELTLIHDGAAHDSVPLNWLARGRIGADGRVPVRRTDAPDWRLLLDADAPAPPPLPRADRPTPRTTRRWTVAIGAAVAIAAGLWIGGDALLAAAAPHVPQVLAARVGDAVVGQLDADRPCEAPAGSAALARMVARIALPGTQPSSVTVVRGDTVNAFAAPGGRVVLFEGIIAKANGPDEIAGVLAHEAAHVRLHHPEQALLRYFGFGLIAGSLGGNMGQAANLVLLLANTRAKEAAADKAAVEALIAAHVDPRPLANLLQRIEALPKPRADDAIDRALDRAGDYGATHPGTSARVAAIRDAPPPTATIPALSSADWVSLRAICS